MAQSRVSIPSKETGVDVITLAGRTRLGRVQRTEIGANLPNTQVQELGSDKYVGRIFDLPEISVTVNAFDVGARTPFLMAGVDWATAASGSRIEMQQISYVCIAQTFKGQGSANKDIARTIYTPGAKLERFSFNYTAAGDSTEEYTFNATDRQYLKYDVIAASGVAGASGLVTLPSTARVLKNGSYVLSAFASGVGYLAPEVVKASTATTVTLDPDVVAPGTPVLVTYHADLADQWMYTYEYAHVAPGYTPAPDQPVGVRGYGVEIYLVASGATSQRVLRAQTCTIQGQFPNTKVQELGTETIVGYMEGIPEVTGTLEIMTFDFKLQELLSNDTAGDNWNPNELGTGNWGLLVKVYRRGVKRDVVGPEKVMWIPALDITQVQDQAQVGQDQRQTFQFSSRNGKLYLYKGEPTVLAE